MSENRPPRNPHYDDVYWSGGVAEKSFVFIEGNALPTRLASLPAHGTFTVAELGFGTGLTCALVLAAMDTHVPQAARQTAQLHLISYECHPLTPAQLQALHAQLPAHDDVALLAPYLERLVTACTHLTPGWNHHRLALTGGLEVQFHLFIGQAETGLATHPHPTDAWLLDGHAPAKNPTLWSGNICHLVASHCRFCATFSTYSAAQSIRQSLQKAGFNIQKIKGFPPKRHMLIGKLA
jgi:tRNA 5-methylaminomethyl-2-thiouridine biosynthesis bifunctional protein